MIYVIVYYPLLYYPENFSKPDFLIIQTILICPLLSIYHKQIFHNNHKYILYIWEGKPVSLLLEGGKIINKSVTCTSIDTIQTGRRLREIIRENNCKVSELQELLNLSCPQPIYRWTKGQVMPSIDNLYMLSRIFEMHMEDMLVVRKAETKANND